MSIESLDVYEMDSEILSLYPERKIQIKRKGEGNFFDGDVSKFSISWNGWVHKIDHWADSSRNEGFTIFLKYGFNGVDVLDIYSRTYFNNNPRLAPVFGVWFYDSENRFLGMCSEFSLPKGTYLASDAIYLKKMRGSLQRKPYYIKWMTGFADLRTSPIGGWRDWPDVLTEVHSL